MELAYKTLKRGGTVVSSGLSHPDKSFSIKHLAELIQKISKFYRKWFLIEIFLHI